MSVIADMYSEGLSRKRPVCSIFGLPIDRLTVREVVEKVESFILSCEPHQVAYLNAHCINRAFDDPEYRDILKQCDLIYPDGMGVVWASHLTHSPLPERVNIGDFLIPFLQLCEEKGYKVYFLGCEPGVADRAVKNFLESVPRLKVAGIHHGYFTKEEEKNIIKEIQETRPDILIVGFGVPEQEKWIYRHLPVLDVPVCWGVGALMEYYSGKVSRAPYWMRANGLEWLYRLILEPGRMWKRYLIGNILFIMRVLALVIVDIMAAAAAWFAAYGLRYALSGSMGPINEIKTYIYAFPVILLLWIFCSAWYGLYHRKKPLSAYQEFYSILKASVLAWIISMSVAFLVKEWDLGRSVIMIAGGLNFVFLLVTRQLSHLLKLDNK